MNALRLSSAGSSEIGDLDGYSIPSDYSYNVHSQYPTGNEDFGFDPPQAAVFPKAEPFSPPTLADPLQLSGWSDFNGSEFQDASLPHQRSALPEKPLPRHDLQNVLNQALCKSNNTISRFGQMTPPRSNSASSEEMTQLVTDSSKNQESEHRRRSVKTSPKDEFDLAQPTTTGRKRKNTRKLSMAKEEQDDKRKQSLEKNRLAAAKCRINKKEKTEQLQRNSHEKAVHNAFLKEQVMRMKEEVQQMNALLLAHANCEGCKSPEEIQKHLSNLGNEFFAHQMSVLDYEYPQISLEEMPRMLQDHTMQAEYYSPSSETASGILNPPLPEFDRAAEFEVHTPMHTD